MVGPPVLDADTGLPAVAGVVPTVADATGAPLVPGLVRDAGAVARPQALPVLAASASGLGEEVAGAVGQETGPRVGLLEVVVGRPALLQADLAEVVATVAPATFLVAAPAGAGRPRPVGATSATRLVPALRAEGALEVEVPTATRN